MAYSEPKILVIRSVTLVDCKSGTTRKGVTVIIENGRIRTVVSDKNAKIPGSAKIIDGQNKWLIPGIIDVCAAEGSAEELNQALKMGITTIRLIPCTNDDFKKPVYSQVSATNEFPRIVLSTDVITEEYPEAICPGEFKYFTPAGPDDARVFLRRLNNEGSLSINLASDNGCLLSGEDHPGKVLSFKTAKAVFEEARKLRMRVYVESSTLARSKFAIVYGANVLVHAAGDSIYEATLLGQMKRNNIMLVPSLTSCYIRGNPRYLAQIVINDSLLKGMLTDEQIVAMRYNCLPLVDDDQTENSTDNFSTYARISTMNLFIAKQNKIPLAIGSNAVPGLYTHVEISILAKAGLSNQEILYAATYGGAIALGMQKETGSVQRGKLADMLVLGADPLENIENIRKIEYVIREGIVFSLNKNPTP